MNEQYQRLKSSLDEWACNAMAVLSRKAILYDDFPPADGAIFSSLISSSEFDGTVQEILHTLFSALSLLVSGFVEEHLPEGKYKVNMKIPLCS